MRKFKFRKRFIGGPLLALLISLGIISQTSERTVTLNWQATVERTDGKILDPGELLGYDLECVDEVVRVAPDTTTYTFTTTNYGTYTCELRSVATGEGEGVELRSEPATAIVIVTPPLFQPKTPQDFTAESV